MITDSRLIDEAIARITGKDACLPLSTDDFNEICPCPTIAIHVLAQNAGEAAEKIRHECEQSVKSELSSIMTYIRSTSLTMADLAMIDKALPRAPRFKKGLEHSNPDGGTLEIWIFAETVQL